MKNILGIMNGTSLDGIDMVLCRRKGKASLVYVGSASVKFPPLLKKRLLEATQDLLSAGESAELSHELGRFYADRVTKVCKKKKWKVNLVGLHGQTIYHNSGKATLQIGEPSYLAHALDCPIVSDFRQADIAVGGKGAPLAGIFHQLITKSKRAVAVQNLGGIANLTYIKNGRVEMCFDSGPANILMDSYCQKYLKIPYDKDGSLARRGVVRVDLLSKLLRHPYLQEKPPKSCGREEFGPQSLKKYEGQIRKISKQDVLATLLEYTAITVSEAYKKNRLKPDTIYLSGGGAKNKRLQERIAYYMGGGCRVVTTKALGWNPQDIEGGAFAYLALLRILNLPANIPKASGAKKAVPLGKIYRP